MWERPSALFTDYTGRVYPLFLAVPFHLHTFTRPIFLRILVAHPLSSEKETYKQTNKQTRARAVQFRGGCKQQKLSFTSRRGVGSIAGKMAAMKCSENSNN